MAIFSGTLLQCTQGELTRGVIIKTSLSFKCSYVNRSLCTVLKTGGWQFQKFTLTPDLPKIFGLRRLSNLWIYLKKSYYTEVKYTQYQYFKMSPNLPTSVRQRWVTHDKISYFDYFRHLNVSHVQSPNTRKVSLRSVTKFRCARFCETKVYKRDRKTI